MTELKWIAKENNGFIVASEGFAVGPFRTAKKAHDYKATLESRSLSSKTRFRVVTLQEPEDLSNPATADEALASFGSRLSEEWGSKALSGVVTEEMRRRNREQREERQAR